MIAAGKTASQSKTRIGIRKTSGKDENQDGLLYARREFSLNCRVRFLNFRKLPRFAMAPNF